MAITRPGAAFAALAALTSLNTAAQIHVFVDDDAPPGGDGLSWATAMNDLREAVQLAENLGEFRGEVRIAGGNYLGDLAEPLRIDRYGGVLSGIVLKGGFAGLALPGAPDTRCLSSFATTLDGTRGIPIIQVNSAAVLTGERQLVPGPFGPLFGFNGARATVFDGLRFVGTQAISVSAEPEAAMIVRDCEFVDADSRSGIGGAIDAKEISLLIESCEFLGCDSLASGGAISHSGGAMIIRDTYFTENTAFIGVGGAVFADSDALRIERSTFTDNTDLDNFRFDDTGGAVHVRGGMVTIEDCAFNGNQAEFGGGVYFVNGTESALIVDSVFDGNRAASGAAVVAEEGVLLHVTGSLFLRGSALGAGAIGAAMLDVDESEFIDNFGAGSGAIAVSAAGVIRNSSFHENCGGRGGAILISEDLDIVGCSFIGNTGSNGGAVYSEGGGTVDRSTFVSNTATGAGGAIHGRVAVTDSTFTSNSAERSGGAGFELESFVDSTATGNMAFSGGALYNPHTVERSTLRENSALFFGDDILIWEAETAIKQVVVGGDSPNSVRVNGFTGLATISDSLLVGGVLTEALAFTELQRCTVVPGRSDNDIVLEVQDIAALIVEASVVHRGTVRVQEDSTALLIQSHLSEGIESIQGSPSEVEVFGSLSVGDPKFASASGADGDVLTWEDNDLRPAPRSPLIDSGYGIFSAGELPRDVAGMERGRNDRGTPDRQIGRAPVDIGAYEFQGTSCLADMNGDGALTPADFSAWIIAYNFEDRFADQNQDEFLSPADFGAWILNYNLGCD